jgi:insulysin
MCPPVFFGSFLMNPVLFRARFLIVLFGLSLLLGACAAAPEADVAADEAIVTKSPNDTRNYRALVLDNGMKVLLVSDPEADKAAASVDINAGSNADPANFAGLAHFLEHMLFLGTAKYQEAGEYQEYIAAHGGSHNAYTAYENTNYYFDIDAAYLEPALDRFAQFFVAPLFTPEYVDRERNAVHSEYQSGLQDDGRRGYSVLKAVMNPAHPLTGFSVGSLDTLQDHDGLSLRDALLAHYDRYYSANMMAVALSGPQTLEELEVLARRFFAPVINRERSMPLSSEPLFTPGALPALLAIEPVRDSRSVTWTFPIPQMRQYYKEKPLSYLGHILGHEGEGSLLALLRAKGWANGLAAGGGFSYTDASTFAVSASLTESGVEHVDEISGLLFQFIDLTRREGIESWIYDELRVMAELAFRYQEPSDPVSYVSSMSRRLQDYPAAELITAAYTYESFQPVLLNQVLDALRPDNVLMTFTSRSVEGDRVDPLYGASYSFAPLSAERLARWQAVPHEATLAINAPNPFLPEKLEIKPFAGTPQPLDVPSAAVKPDLIVDEGGVRLWFKQDNEFLIPRANFSVYALTELFGDNLRNSLLSNFAVSLVNDKLNEYSYPVNLAGAAFGIGSRSRGFTLSVSGYTDKQTELLETLLQTLVATDFDEERFSIIKAEMIRGWENAELQTPYVRLFQEAQALLVSPYWSEEERIAAVRDITLDDVKAFVPRMLENLRIEAFYHGNIVQDDARQMLDIVTRYLEPSADAPKPTFGTVVNLPEATRIVQELEIPHDDSAIVIYVQGEDDRLKTRATITLLAQLLRTPFYDTLRTEQQLGYIVNAGTLPILKTNGLVMYIESPVADPLRLEAAIDAFLAGYGGELAMLDPAVFEATKAGLVTELRQPPQRMNSLSARYWSDILIEEYTVDSTLQMADAIEALTLADLVAWYDARVASPESGRLVARSAGRPQLTSFLAARAEDADTLIMDDGNADYLPFKQQAEQFEF